MAAPGFIVDAGDGIALIPPGASVNAAQYDLLFYTMAAITVTVSVAITLALLYFSIRYRKGSAAERRPAGRTLVGELSWTIPTVLVFLAAFLWAAALYVDWFRTPPDAVVVNVIGKQWMWKVQHENGAREINELHVPVGQRIELRMTSQDVIHSFFVPAFRLKRDVLPQAYTSLWFEATRPGTYSLFCAEYCGTDHSRMRGRVVVMAPDDYARWLDRQEVAAAPASEGARLFRAYGCSGCHAPRADVHAPDLAGLYGRPVPLADGTMVTADDDYLRDSILLPRKHVVAGYQPIMPSFEGQVSEADILKLIAYIRSLDDGEEAR